ncbi:hypothetical protein bthur0005_58720 [Bacillus thuringiensis serovar pakistani str. T13001]|nr:hypothetical protein bthur0005_58720 [Bacillus thuringiensis serovar pakistani str. T13001]
MGFFKAIATGLAGIMKKYSVIVKIYINIMHVWMICKRNFGKEVEKS